MPLQTGKEMPPPHEPNNELTSLISRVAIGIARHKKRAKIVQWYIEIVNIFPWITLSFLISTRGKAHYIIWVYLAEVTVKRSVLNLARSYWVMYQEPAEQEALIKLLVRQEVESIGVLIDTLHWTNTAWQRDHLRQTLGNLLPQMSPQQVLALGKERHGLLAGWIKTWEKQGNTGFYSPLLGMLHVMTCLGQSTFQEKDRTGGTTSVSLLPILERWSFGMGAGQVPKVQQAAIACREAITQQQILARSSGQLLRASAPTLEAPEELLRPAHGAAQTDPQELLRPRTSTLPQ